MLQFKSGKPDPPINEIELLQDDLNGIAQERVKIINEVNKREKELKAFKVESNMKLGTLLHKMNKLDTEIRKLKNSPKETADDGTGSI